MGLRRFNLNSLAVLHALLRHRNVTLAGREVGLSQSATSHTLAKLREQFSDELLVPVGREMLLTHKGQSLVEPLGSALAIVEALLDTGAFDPSTATRSFRIGTADHIGALILPELLKELGHAAPNVTVLVDWVDRDIAAKLRSSEIDVAILREPPDRTDFHSKRLFEDKLVVIASAENRGATSPMAIEAFERLTFASYGRGLRERPSFAEQQLRKQGIEPLERVIVPDFMLLCHIVAQTNCISLVPHHLVRLLGQKLGLKIIEPPFKTEQLIASAYWSDQADQDAGHRWFREAMLRTCRNLHL